MIRPATPADAAAIQTIWNDLIRTTTVTFNSGQKTKAEVAELLKDRPVFVADTEQVVGYATYGPFRGGVGYQHIAEHSIVLRQDAQGQGLGRKLVDAIESHAKASDINSLIAGVSGENEAGIAFHSHLGFREVGRIPNAGFKFNRWITLVLMQKHL